MHLSCRPRPRMLLALAACGWLTSAAGADGGSDASVSIRTTGQRLLTGTIDARTDQRRLWIRRQAEGIVLTTSIDWASISSAQLDGASIEIADLARVAKQLASEGPVLLTQSPSVADSTRSALARRENWSLQSRRCCARSQRVTSIWIDAALVNMDRDLEADGIEAAVAALDASGRSVAVKGHLTARLAAVRSDSHTGRTRFEDVQRWTRATSTADFSTGAAVFQLPFTTVRPEQDLELHSEGILTIRLSVHGEGNFEASIPLAIRAFNPVRDTLQQVEGHRFLPGEFSGRPGRSMAPRASEGAPVWTPYGVTNVRGGH